MGATMVEAVDKRRAGSDLSPPRPTCARSWKHAGPRSRKRTRSMAELIAALDEADHPRAAAPPAPLAKAAEPEKPPSLPPRPSRPSRRPRRARNGRRAADCPRRC